MRTLAIDVGSRRVGLALSDEGGKLATPLDVLTVRSPDAAIASILDVIRKEDVQQIVVGMPLNMDGTFGPAAWQAAAWARELAEKSAIPVVLVDERLSSFEAEQQLAERKRAGETLTRKRRKQQVDALAAAGFLQAFLDGRLAPVTPPDTISPS